MKAIKISISLDKSQLLLARRAAKAERISLSAYIGRSLEFQLEEQVRIDASRALHASWGAASVPTSKEREEFLAQMARRPKRRSKAA